MTVIFWAGFALAMVVLLARRFVLRRRVSLLAHAAVTVVVLVVLADLRNSVDYARNAQAAIQVRGNSATVFDVLDDLESGVPWFGPAAEFLVQNIKPDESYFLAVRGEERGAVKIAVMRLVYYAGSARRTHDADEAQFALLWAQPRAKVDQFRQSDEWNLKEVLPANMFVFERKE